METGMVMSANGGFGHSASSHHRGLTRRKDNRVANRGKCYKLHIPLDHCSDAMIATFADELGNLRPRQKLRRRALLRLINQRSAVLFNNSRLAMAS